MRLPAAAGLAIAVLSIGSPPAGAAFRIILDEPAMQQPGPGPADRRSRAEPERRRLGPPPASGSGKCTAVVRRGDSLSILARRHLGDERRWREIQALNHIREPDLIGAGWELELPCDGFSAVAAGAPDRDPRDPPPPVPEIVRKRDGASPAMSPEELAAGLSEADGRREGPSAGTSAGAAADSPETAATAVTETGPAAAPTGQDGTDGSDRTGDAAATRPDSPSPDCSVKVTRNDTLADLAGRHLGDSGRWPEISALNSLSDPDRITVGQRLLLPCAQDARTADMPPAASGGEREAPAPAPEPAPAAHWSAAAGELLDDVISRWANAAGWTAIVTERWYWVLDTDVSFSGTFLDSVEELLSGFSSAGQAPGVTVYANQMLVLEYR